MQKVIATVLASLLLFPAGSLAQDSKVNDGPKIGQGTVIASNGTLRESAIRQARLAVATDAAVQAPQNPSWRSRHPGGFAGLIGLAGGALTGLFYHPGCTDGFDVPCAMYSAPLGALVGSVVGALTGAIVADIRKP